MKNRLGFVSNSSSSSFLIYGVALDRSEVLECLKPEKPEVDEDAEDEYEDVYEALEDAISSQEGLEYHIPYDDTVYIGACWSSIGDDETGAQFKNRVKAQLTEMFGDVKCSTHSEAWYN